MLGKPIESGDVLMLVLLATAVVVVLIATFGQLVKPRPGFTPPPSAETIARARRNIRINMTLCGVSLGLSAIGSLLLHRVPEPMWWSILLLQLAVVAALFVQLIRQRRERRRLKAAGV